ncbi:MAG: outer membrane protein assembly factor BamD [Chitinophagales bacterium]
MTYRPFLSKLTLIFLVLLTLASSCALSKKSLESKSPEDKLALAMTYYGKGQYFKAIPLFEELLPIYRGTDKRAEIYFYYAKAQYEMDNAIMAGFHFKRLYDQHGLSDFAEESLFMHAESYYAQSPKWSLDQTPTYEALQAYQNFINIYPTSERVELCNNRIDLLRDKLERKALEAANLYYRTRDFRAAAIAYENLFLEFPDIENPSDLYFLAAMSYFKYAERSFIDKQGERYKIAIDKLKLVQALYPEHPKFATCDEFIVKSELGVLSASVNMIYTRPIDERIPAVNEAIQSLEKAAWMDGNESYEFQRQELLERAAYISVQTHYELALSSEENQQYRWHTDLVNISNKYLESFASSKNAREVQKIRDYSRTFIDRF